MGRFVDVGLALAADNGWAIVLLRAARGILKHHGAHCTAVEVHACEFWQMPLAAPVENSVALSMFTCFDMF